MVLRIAYLIQWLGDTFTLLLFIRAILSWISNSSLPGSRGIYEALVKITEPVVSPCRKLLDKVYSGPIDFSVFAAMVLVEIIERLVITIMLKVFV